MCSRVLGPAMPPPRVTWPTSSTAGPVSLANRMSRAAHSRTWSGDSSPETYSVRIPACSRRAAHWSSSVDLPIPGSPPTSTTDPGTIPPPNTKSNSGRPVLHRSTLLLSTSESRTGGTLEGSAFPRSTFPTFRPTTSSTSVFHAPHASQRPPHFGCSAPQSVQRNTECALPTAGLDGRLARRIVVEAGVFLLEEQLHAPGGTVALLPDDQLRQPFDVLVRLRVHRPVVELL